MKVIDLIKQKASALQPELIAMRRHLHMHPELSMQELETSAFIRKKLSEYNIPFTSGIAVHGIVGLIKGKNPESQTIALRADMDALPIIEKNQVEYCSQNPGVMHACGHDVHMTSLLGAAIILNEIKDHFEGTIKLIFQPSEERFPGGASMMIKEGVLENPAPQKMFGQHVLPTLEAGKVGMKPGKYMASTDEVYLTVKGKGGHGATPELNVDPVLIAAHLLIALQQIVSRNTPPQLPAVLSFGRFIAEGRTNIIPNEVKLDGTLRTFDEKWRAEAHEKITLMATSIAEGMGGKCEVFIDKGYPFLVNDEAVTAEARQSAVEYLGEENVVDLDLRMTAEDFAYFSQRIPSCFYRLGIRNESRGIIHNLHTDQFDVDETSLETGAGLMAWMAVRGMEK
ncbi:MAG: amidohydrolase [Bacteroidetes bacterium HGW-Bacteroidetes-11]|jgi:amidohydrolase|nr:MAG: amidohydrolase [Bacteroidetes bacterium HGW-Bacteroidetes-11]